MSSRKITCISAALVAGVSMFCSAAERGHIVSFDDDDIEVRIDGKIEYMSRDAFDSPPLVILDRDASEFLKVKTRRQGDVWVSPSYVTTDQQQGNKVVCQKQQLSQSGDSSHYGVRGVGEECE